MHPLVETNQQQITQPSDTTQPLTKKTKAQKKADRAASQSRGSNDNGGGNNKNTKGNKSNTVSGVVLDPKTLAPMQSMIDRLQNTVAKLAPAVGQPAADSGPKGNNNRNRSVSQRKGEDKSQIPCFKYLRNNGCSDPCPDGRQHRQCATDKERAAYAVWSAKQKLLLVDNIHQRPRERKR